MTDNSIIQCQQISKVFKLRRTGPLLGHPGRAQGDKRTYQALHNIDLCVQPGEVVGLVGLNGSGKTTLSRIIAGVSQPSSGVVRVNGTVGLLAANAGLNSALTGRENIYYKCLLLGFTMHQIQQMEESIIAFAELKHFIDQPLKTYSSGMRSRLGFAVCTHTDPDVLIVDEALAVGDQSYMAKCMAWIHEYIQRKRCVIFVSHATNQMRGLCNRVLWLHKGECVGLGTVDEILPSYQAFAQEYNKIRNTPNAEMPCLEQYQQRIKQLQHGG